MAFEFNPFTGTLDITWNRTELNSEYLRLDCSNDPLTGDLATNENLTLLDNKQLRFGNDGATDSYIEFDATDFHLYTSGDFMFTTDTTYSVLKGDDDGGGGGTGTAGRLILYDANGEAGGNVYLYGGTAGGDAPAGKLYLGSALEDSLPRGQVWFYKTTPAYFGDYDANSARIYHDGTDLIIDSRYTGTGGTLLFPTGMDIDGDINFNQVPEVTLAQKNAFTVTADVGGTLAAGEYHYDVYFICAEGGTRTIQAVFGTDSVPSATCLANGSFNLTNIPISLDRRVTSRAIMRNEAGEAGQLCKVIYTIPDNTTTELIDAGYAPGTGAVNYAKPNTTAGTILIDNVIAFRADDNNTFMGIGAGLNIAGAYGCNGVGRSALKNLSTGIYNDGFGQLVLELLTTGSSNVAMGQNAGYSLKTGKWNICIGGLTYPNGTVGDNEGMVLIGYAAGYNGPGTNEDGTVRIGHRAGERLAGGNDVIIGRDAGYHSSRITGTYRNILIGAFTGTTISTNSRYNVLIGNDVEPISPTTGYELNLANVLRGGMVAASEYLWLPYDKPFYFGAAKDVSIKFDGSNMIINSENITASDKLYFTNFDTYYFDGKVGIGTATPDVKLQVVGSFTDGIVAKMYGLNNDGVRFTIYVNDTGTFGALYARDDNDGGATDFAKTYLGRDDTGCLVLDGANSKVGIGTGTPDTKLQVVGDLKVGDDNTNYVNVGTTGDVTFVGGAGFYPRRIRQAGIPASGTDATQIDVGEMIIWEDSDDDSVHFVYNDTTAGIKSVALT